MAKRSEKSHLLATLAREKREEDFIERLVLPTDTLQGIALLYNTTVSSLKKLNHLEKDSELHGRRIIKVPSRGILVDLNNVISPPVVKKEEDSTEYLNNVDVVLKGIRERVEEMGGSVVEEVGVGAARRGELMAKPSEEEVAWWKIALPCFAILIILPYLIYLYLEGHLHPGGHGSLIEEEEHVRLYH